MPRPPDRKLGFLLHLGRREKLFLLVLELHEFVESDVNLPGGEVGREVVRQHRHDHRGKGVDRAAFEVHDGRAAPQERRAEHRKDADPKPDDRFMVLSFHIVFLLSKQGRAGAETAGSSGVSGFGLSGTSGFSGGVGIFGAYRDRPELVCPGYPGRQAYRDRRDSGLPFPDCSDCPGYRACRDFQDQDPVPARVPYKSRCT